MEMQTKATVSRYRSYNRIREEIDPGFVRRRPARLPQLPFHCLEIGLKFGFNLSELRFCAPVFLCRTEEAEGRGEMSRSPCNASRATVNRPD